MTAPAPGPQAAPRAPGVALPHVLGALAASVGLALGFGAAVGPRLQGDALVLAVLAVQWTPLLLWTLLAAAARPEGVRAALALRARWSDLPLGVGVGFGALLLSGLAVALTPWRIDVPPAAEGLLGADGASGVLVVLAVAVGAPFVEELVFRGALVGALLRLRLPAVAVVLVSAAAFALLHLEPTRVHVVLLTGVVLGVLRLATGRLGPCVVAHATVNSAAVLAALALS